MSQIVSVADIYEAITGARTYQAPTPPERACLILARIAGEISSRPCKEVRERDHVLPGGVSGPDEQE